jgi:hypothetical protein
MAQRACRFLAEGKPPPGSIVPEARADRGHRTRQETVLTDPEGVCEMTHLSGTFHRPTHVTPAALAAFVAATAVVVVLAAVALGVRVPTTQAPEAAVPAVPAPHTDRASILAGLQSEYLRSIARDWYVTAPAMPVGRDKVIGPFYSEYLPSIAGTWNGVAVPAPRIDRAAILAGLQSEYLRFIARSWYATETDVDPNLLYSEYLREIARDW